MPDDVSYIGTLTVQQTLHGSLVTGKSEKVSSAAEWWSTWTTATPCKLAEEMSTLGIVYNYETPLFSGIVSVRYVKDNDTYEIAVPTKPLFFGVRLAVVYADERVYYKRDPDCYEELPFNFVAWISGIMCEFHDPTIGEMHSKRGSWALVREWMKTKNNKVIDTRTVWSVFRDAYATAVEHLSQREAYVQAVDYTVEVVKSVENLQALSEFKSRWSAVSTNASELLKTLKTEQESADYRLCVAEMERLRNAFIDFGIAESFKSELDLATAALDSEGTYNDLLQKVHDSVACLKDNCAHAEHVDALICALELIQNEYRESDLFVVIDAFTYIKTGRTILYETENVKNLSLRKTLDSYNKRKTTVEKDERRCIDRAREFTKGENILSWKLRDFYDVLQQHKRLTVEPAEPMSDCTFLSVIQMQLERESQGIFYRKEIGCQASLSRNGFGLDDYYISELQNLSGDRNTPVEKILEAEMIREFGRLKYWELKSELVSTVNDALVRVCRLATLLSSDKITDESAWPDLPLCFHTSITAAKFENPEDIDMYVNACRNFRKPVSREWPAVVQELETSSFNSTIESMVGKTLRRMWNESVVRKWKASQDRVRKAEQTYEEAINEIVQLAEVKTSDLGAVYGATIRKCHSTTRGTTTYETWWELLESEFVQRAPEVFGHIAKVEDRERMVQHVVDNRWKIAMVPDETTHERWIEDLSHALLQRARNVTAKQMLSDVAKHIADAIGYRSSVWKEGKENIDRTTGDFYDIEFISDDDDDVVTVSSAEFRRLKPELYRILVYAVRIYGIAEIGKELFNWLADGEGRWMVTNHHAKEQFASSNSDDAFECFYGTLSTLLFDFYNVHEVCFSQLTPQTTEICNALLKSFPIYGRISSDMRGWSTPYGHETETAVDLFERLPVLACFDEIPQHRPITLGQNVEMCREVMKMLNGRLDITLLGQCISGKMWLPSSSLYDHWAAWRSKWLSGARKVVFDYSGTRLLCAVNKQQTHNFDVLKDNSQELADFVDRHRISRNVIAKFSQPRESETNANLLPPTILNSEILDDIQAALSLPEEDDFYFDEDAYDHNINFGFFTEPPSFPTLRQEFAELEISIRQQDDGPAADTSQVEDLTLGELEVAQSTEDASQLIKQLADLTLDDNDEKGEEHQKHKVIVKTKNLKRHLTALTELFDLVRRHEHERRDSSFAGIVQPSFRDSK